MLPSLEAKLNVQPQKIEKLKTNSRPKIEVSISQRKIIYCKYPYLESKGKFQCK